MEVAMKQDDIKYACLIFKYRGYSSASFYFFSQLSVDFSLQADGGPDLEYFAPDCFHLSAKGHKAAAEALWNNMVMELLFIIAGIAVKNQFCCAFLEFWCFSSFCVSILSLYLQYQVEPVGQKRLAWTPDEPVECPSAVSGIQETLNLEHRAVLKCFWFS